MGGYEWIFFIVVAVILFGSMFLNSRRQKKRQEEGQKLIDALKPGNKVKTIGGICGVIAEICRDDNTFVLETGTAKTGKSYIKFDMQAIYQTDAVVENKDEKTEEKKADKKVEKKEETAPAVEEVAVETQTEEAPAVEEKPAKKTTKKKNA